MPERRVEPKKSMRGPATLRALGRHVARASLLAVVACVPLPDESTDGGADAAVFHPVEGGAVDAPLPLCGDVRCSEPVSSNPLGETACCLPSGRCGLESTLLGTACLPRGARGGVDLSCPGRFVPGGENVQGCCGASGRCGLLDPTGELGCIDSAPDAAACAFHPGNDCSSIVDLPCDGPEDCANGQVCCGRAERDGYDLFGCFASCDGLFDGQSGVWTEICHPGSACLNSGFVCEPSRLLPSFLARCRDPGPPALPAKRDGAADAPFDQATSLDASLTVDASVSAEASAAPTPGVRCGPSNCAPDEKCCLRTHRSPAEAAAPPVDPYCAKANARCACTPDADR